MSDQEVSDSDSEPESEDCDHDFQVVPFGHEDYVRCTKCGEPGSMPPQQEELAASPAIVIILLLIAVAVVAGMILIKGCDKDPFVSSVQMVAD